MQGKKQPGMFMVTDRITSCNITILMKHGGITRSALYRFAFSPALHAGLICSDSSSFPSSFSSIPLY